MKQLAWTMTVVGLLGFCAGAQAGLPIEVPMVLVSDPGNVPDTRYETPGYGGVGSVYNIGEHEVTNGQYAEFLNAVDPAGTNPQGLYNSSMGGGWNDIGGISFLPGEPSGEKYVVREPRGNRPVNYVSWYDTLRFANWMHNSPGSGDTEDGAYDMSLGASVVRKPGALVFLPTEDEWYKAAYYKGGGTNAGYWDYPTQSDTAPTAELPPGTDMVNGSANYYSGGYVDPTYYTTEVGAYYAKPSDSAYGTFDQGGNVWEWHEAVIESSRGVRGGSFDSREVDQLHAAYRSQVSPSDEFGHIGFRVAEVPEPAALSLLLFGGIVALKRRR